MNFLRTFFASLLGSFAALGLLLFFFFISVAGIATTISSQETLTTIKDNSILSLNLNRVVRDRSQQFDAFQALFDMDDQPLGLNTIIAGIQKAAADDRIKGIKLRSDITMSGWAQTHAIREALKGFRKSGKFIYAYADVLTQKGYYLASVADSIMLNPAGMLDFKGLSSEVLYYKDFQEKYGVKMEVIRHGKYKSAVEPYLEKSMSVDNRKQIKALLTTIWDTIRDEIATDRSLTPETLDAIATEVSAALPEQAVEKQLIDILGYEDEFDTMLKEAIGMPLTKKIKEVNVQDMNASKSSYDKTIKDRIAVIYAQGPILYGEGSESVIAQGLFVKEIEKATNDDWIKAIVLRVNSPGGSALTSEILWRSLERAKEKKPLVVSMGNTAASGGYYIAAGADKIFADPLTVTGSIGVFATLPNLKNLSTAMGINAEQVSTHENAMGYSVFEPLSAGYKKTTLASIENIYEMFKERVSDGRKLTLEEVEKIAQGRVWSGKNALEVGLVDALGSLDDAVTAAAELAEIDEYNRMEYPQIEANIESLLSGINPTNLFQNKIEKIIPEEIKPLFENSKLKNQLVGIQARIPFEIRIY